MTCQLCNSSIGGGLTPEEEQQLKLFGASKYGKCPHCGHPKELYGLSPAKIKTWKREVDIYLLAADKNPQKLHR